MGCSEYCSSEHPGCAVYYTDGSRDPEAGRTGAGVHHATLTAGWRLQDHCTILQAELHAIQRALQHTLLDHRRPPVIHVDSRAAIQAVMHREPRDNIRLITAIRKDLQTLKEQGQQATINWIPSHIDLAGNDAADRAAKSATLEAQPVTTIAISRRQVDLWAADAARRPLPGPGTSRSRIWYDRATRGEPPPSMRRLDRKLQVGVHRLRLGYPTARRLIDRVREERCCHCNQMVPGPLVHYLLDCPATVPLRRRHFPMAPGDPNREDTAARLVYLATQDLGTLIPILAAHPPPR
nr:uncharacterized protein LOC128691837 [Cherax quadricarinatus]